jgi:hypothetical protein
VDWRKIDTYLQFPLIHLSFSEISFLKKKNNIELYALKNSLFPFKLILYGRAISSKNN